MLLNVSYETAPEKPQRYANTHEPSKGERLSSKNKNVKSHQSTSGRPGHHHKTSELFARNFDKPQTAEPKKDKKPSSNVLSLQPTEFSEADLQKIFKGAKTSFAELSLNPLLLATLVRSGFTRPSHIQSMAAQVLTPAALLSSSNHFHGCSLTEFEASLQNAMLIPRDAVLNAPTGSGKSLAYLLPMLHTLLSLYRSADTLSTKKDYFAETSTAVQEMDRSAGTFAIIITPTRELSVQIAEVASKLLSFPSMESLDADTQSAVTSLPRWIVPGTLLSGVNRAKEKARLRTGTTLLISTPGRLLDHLKSTQNWSMKHLAWVVLEEADKFLVDAGSAETLRQIWTLLDDRLHFRYRPPSSMRKPTDGAEQLPSKSSIKSADKKSVEPTPAETLLDVGHRPWSLWMVTATLSSSELPKSIAGLPLHNPLLLSSRDQEETTESSTSPDEETLTGMTASTLEFSALLDQGVVAVPTKLRLVTLLASLSGMALSKTKNAKIMVFVSTCDLVDYFFFLLANLDISRNSSGDVLPNETDTVLRAPLFGSKSRVIRLHGNREPLQRAAALKAFSKKDEESVPGEDAPLTIMIASNLAARGLDFPDVSLIVQYDPPLQPADYMHRVGRTARFQGKGSSLLFLLENEEKPFRQAMDAALKEQGGAEWQPRLVPPSALWNNLLARWSTAEKETLKRLASRTLSETPFGNETEHLLTGLQVLIEECLVMQSKLSNLAKLAYCSSIKSYATYTSEMKQGGMNTRSLHLGHYAKSFGLREPPKRIARQTDILSKSPSESSTGRDHFTKKRKMNSLLNEMDSDVEEMSIEKKRSASKKKPSAATVSEFSSGTDLASLRASISQRI